MPMPSLTLRSLRARPVVLTLKRPVVARIATITQWPLVLIDLATEEGIIGRAYLAAYIVKATRYLVPALNDLGPRCKVGASRLSSLSMPRANLYTSSAMKVCRQSPLSASTWRPGMPWRGRQTRRSAFCSADRSAPSAATTAPACG
jgi:Mandelate racemase / muconate lactonizing enzyme, N-terminal domain